MAEFEFYGAADRVTGSCHIIRAGGRTVLFDCGLVQGGREDERGNAGAFPFDPAGVDAVVLSHAHLDHSGRLPLLVKRGFNGVIHTHKATNALLRILLADAADIEMSVIRRENRHRAAQGRDLLTPLFDRADVTRTIELVEPHRYHEAFEVVPGMRVRLHDAGHILGAAVVEARFADGDGDASLVFSGDLGQFGSPILRDPESPDEADLVVMETTYGDRCHRDLTRSVEELGEVLAHASRVGGNVLIPAFAVGRSQEILYFLGTHYQAWNLDRWQIFLDSPLAIEASEIYWDFPQLFDEQAGELFREQYFMPRLPNLHFTRTSEESKVISRMKRGAIIIAGSGMCNGGRILHHFRRDLGRPQTQVIFTGFQPPGTLGRRLIDGADSVRIHGENYPVRATMHTIGGFSAHADQHDLLRWYHGIARQAGGARPPTYLVHGDPGASAAFREVLTAEGVDRAIVARPGDVVTLQRRVLRPG